MSVLNFLKPAPYREEIRDPELVKKSYQYWRLRTFYAMYLGYAFYYFTRKSFTFAMPAMQAELGLGKFELGILASTLSLTYGASKFLSGILGDKSNPRYFMAIGLILTGVFNLLFGMSTALWAFAICWGINGWFQGWGWPGCAKLLTHWYSQSERGRWWGIWNTSHNLGGFIISFLGPLCANLFGWRFAMYVPGVLCIGVGLLLIDRLRDTPQSLGLPPIERFRGEASPTEKARSELSTREILFEFVLRNKYIWVLSASYFFVYVIRTAVNDWSMLYLVEVRHYSHLTAGACVSAFEIGGFVGSLAAGWVSDLVFGGKRNPVNVLFSAAILLVILGMWSFHSNSPTIGPLVDGSILFLFGFFIFGPQMMIGISAAELSHKKAAATATGFAGCFAYLGAAAAGAPLGAITKNWGWDAYLAALSVCAFLAAVLLIPLWSVRSNPKEAASQTTS